MDGLGYDGWSRGSASLNSEDAAGESSASFSFSAPAAGRAGVMGNAHTSNLSRNARDASANNARGGKSDYDYDISLDDVDDYEGSLSAGDIRDQIPKRTSSQEPRLSQAERTQQLIQRASSERRATLSRERAARDDDTAAFSSFQDSWNELMQGLESHPASASLSRSPSISPNPTLGADVSPLRATSASSAVGRTFGSLRSPNDSDSFEISAGDFEVGALAARRSKEKAQERRRGRRSFDFDQRPTKSAMSPEPAAAVTKTVAPRGVAAGSDSYALSSIDHADDAAVRIGGSGSESKFYGGVDKSDGELFAKLSANRGKAGTGAPRADGGERAPPPSISSAPPSRQSEDDYDYSSDDFEPSIQADSKGKPTTTDGLHGNMISSGSSLRLSEAEIERRKSLELIQQRWFSAQPVEPPKAIESAVEEPFAQSKTDEGYRDTASFDSSVISTKPSAEPASISENRVVDTTEVSDPPSPPSSAAASFSASAEGSLRAQESSNAVEADPELNEAGDDSDAKVTVPRVRVSFDLGKNIHYEIADLDESSASRDITLAQRADVIDAQVPSRIDIVDNLQISNVAPPVGPASAFVSSDTIAQKKNPDVQKLMSNSRKMIESMAPRADEKRALAMAGTESFEAKVAPALEVVVPSIDDLHAQLAAIKAAEKRRKESRLTKQPAAIPSHSIPYHERKRKSVSPPPPPLPSSAPEWDSLSRLEQSNARLNRQFDELNNEIRQLRGGVLNKFVAKPAYGSMKSRSTTNTGSRLDRSDLGSRGAGRLGASGESAAGAVTREKEERPSRPVFQEWDDDALSCAKDIVKANSELKQKENEISERERIVEIKENLINQSLSTRQKNSQSTTSYDSEIADLKSQLFQANQQIFQLHAAARRAFGEPEDPSISDKEKNWDSTHYFQLTASYLNRIGGSNKFKPSISSTHVKSSSEPAFDDAGGCWISGNYFIPNSVFLTLQKEKAGLETLLESSQKENERLMGLIKAHEKDTKQKDAIYFDQQSELVMEINRLKNQLEKFVGVPIVLENLGSAGNVGLSAMAAPAHIGAINSASNTRAMLESEAAVWRLTERLAESEARAAEREHKLQQTIGKLKLELGKATGGSQSRTYNPEALLRDQRKLNFSSKLVGAAASLGGSEPFLDADDELPPPPPGGRPSLDLETSFGEVSPEDLEISRLRVVLEEQKVAYEKEIDDLRSRLLWYAENQKRIDAVEREQDLRQLKSPKLNTSHSSGSRHSVSRRDERDVRRIRELEKTCADLSDALKKRFPDSTASLLYAASSAGMGANPAEVDALKRENASLKDEIESNRVDFDIKLRALRQEYEKMRIEYEVKSKKSIGDASVSTRVSNPKTRDIHDSTSTISGIRSMSQALQKIRELEQNEGRLRAFYARKIEQLNKRFESQLLALKRGGSATSNPEQNIEDPSKLANDNYKLQVERKELVCRIQMLEDELMRTAEELGRVRNAGEVGKEHARQATDSSSHVSGAIEEQRREIDQLKIEIRTLSDLKSKEALPSVESGIPVSDLNLERLLTDRDGRIRELEARVSDYRAQIDVLSRREAEGAGAAAHLSDLQVRISSLITENAALQMQVKEMSLSPILLQFHALENHISLLEGKLSARAEELRRATEDGKAAIHMERIRLQSIHEQEIREKDSQILLFQQQLDEIVDSLRQEQLINQ